jgi:hypothetical protein
MRLPGQVQPLPDQRNQRNIAGRYGFQELRYLVGQRLVANQRLSDSLTEAVVEHVALMACDGGSASVSQMFDFSREISGTTEMSEHASVGYGSNQAHVLM